MSGSDLHVSRNSIRCSVIASALTLFVAGCVGHTNDHSLGQSTQSVIVCPEPTTLDANGEPRNADGDIRYCWPGEALCHCDQDNDCYAQPGYVPCIPPGTDGGMDGGTCPPEPTTLDRNGEPRNAAGDIRYCWPGEVLCHCDQDNDCYAQPGYVPCTSTSSDAGTDAGGTTCPPEPTTLDAKGEPRNAAGDIRYCWPGEAFCHCDQDNDCYAQPGYVPCSALDGGTDAGVDAGSDTGVDAGSDAGLCPPEPTTIDASGQPRNAAGDIRFCWPGEAFCYCDSDNDCYPRSGYVPCGSFGRVTSVDFTVSPTAAVVNQRVTIRATSVGSAEPRYHFFVVTPSGTYTEPCGGYTYVASCSFTPGISGDWQIAVSARDVASTATYEATTNERYYGVADLSASMSLDAATDRGPVNRSLYGGNFEYIGANTPAIEPIASGTPLIRFPGGDGEALFLWSDPDPGTCSVPQWTWPSAATFASGHGMSVVLETNLVRSNPTNAADWVADAVARGLTVSYVGIGNEPWGDWDAGFRSAAQYANDLRAYATAIRARVPGTRIVASVGTFNYDSWNREVVRLAGDVIDAVDYHYYPNKEASPDPMEVAAGADGVAPLVSRLRAMIAAEAPAYASHIQILLGEYDGAGDGSRYPPVAPNHAYAVWSMPDALFYGSAIGEMMRANVAAGMFYEMQGFRFGFVGGNACLPADYAIRRPKSLAMQLYREHFGDRLVALTANSVPTFYSDGPTQWDGFAGTAPLVRAYASTADGGNTLRLIVVNRSASQSVAVSFALNGFVPARLGQSWFIAGDSILATNENVGGPTDAVRILNRAIPAGATNFVFAAPAHSVSAVVLQRGL